jgi:RNA binding exosome subunit
VRVHVTEEGERVLRSLAQALHAERQRLKRVVLELDQGFAGDPDD